MHAHGGWVSETAMGLIRPTWRCEEIDGESETAKGLILTRWPAETRRVGGGERDEESRRRGGGDDAGRRRRVSLLFSRYR
jgi:hypothetical protein